MNDMQVISDWEMDFLIWKFHTVNQNGGVQEHLLRAHENI